MRLDARHLDPPPELVVIGNVCAAAIPAVAAFGATSG
jgi:hypothetical protein